MTFAEKIKQIRESRGLTQKEVASLMGISQQAYGQYESGTRLPKPETVGRIAAALDCQVDEIVQCTDALSYGGRDGNSNYMKEFIHGALIQWNTENAVLKKYDHSSNPKLEKLIASFDTLNDDGQTVAVDRVEELAQIPKYQRSTDGPQDTPAGPDDKEPAEK